jgi:hypothetical protein
MAILFFYEKELQQRFPQVWNDLSAGWQASYHIPISVESLNYLPDCGPMKMEDDEERWCTEAIRFFQDKMSKDRRAELGIRKTRKRTSLEDPEDPVPSPKSRTSSVKGGRTKVPATTSSPVPTRSSRPVATPSKTDHTPPSRPAATPSKTDRTPPSRPAATPSETAGASSTPQGKPEEFYPVILEEDFERVNGGKSLSEQEAMAFVINL